MASEEEEPALVHVVVDEELRPPVTKIAHPLAVVVNLDAVLGLAAAALPQFCISHLLAFHRVRELGGKAEEVPGPGKHVDYAGGPPLGREVGRWLECRFFRPELRRTTGGRGRRTRPHRAGSGGPEGSEGLLVLAARWPPAATGWRRSGRHRWRVAPSSFPRTTGPPSARGPLATGSQGYPGGGGGSNGGGGHGSEGHQSLLVAALLRASAFPRRGRRHLRRFSSPPTPLTFSGRTAKGRHGQAKLGGRAEEW
jgi:hypothetical protein